MFDMARHLRVRELLDEVTVVEDELGFNELEMVRHLKEKYADPGNNDADDVVALEVILRNVEIRRGYNVDVKKHPGRVISMTKRDSEEP